MTARERKPSKRSPVQTRESKKQARPAELVKAALELFLENGFSATRLDDVAARAGVSKGTVYLYFPSKEALFEGVIRQAIVPELSQVQQRVQAHSGSAAEQLKMVLRDWMGIITNTPLGRIPRLVIADVDKFPELADTFHEGIVVPCRALLREVFSHGIKTGEFKIENLDAAVEAVLGTLWMPAITRESMAFRSELKPDLSEYFVTLLNLITVGLSGDSIHSQQR